jgi:hypothetical protein
VSVIDTLEKGARKLADDVQTSMRRARLEGERRMVMRHHRSALEELGQRAYEAVRAGTIPEALLAPEIAAVEAKLGELETKLSEIDRLREDRADGGPGASDDGDAGPSAGPGWDAADRYFRS